MNPWQIHRLSDYAIQPWHNGQGHTREIMREDNRSGTRFRWRLSMADVTHDAPFSHYGGYQRILSLLEGDGLELTIDGTPQPMLHGGDIARFSGDSRVTSQLCDGMVRDLNLIYDPRHYGARLQWLAIRPEMPPLRCHASTILLFCREGAVTLTPLGAAKALHLERYDSATLITPCPQTHSLDLSGHGQLGVFELTAFPE
ncbi:HutD/Ves family protein [Edwardsiella tarda]|uniref:HutD/Ves family protein n=1 Tax=Edwardsiella tarda TaxID=636 RepID=UPI003F65795D